MSSQSSQLTQESDCSSNALIHTVCKIVKRLKSPSGADVSKFVHSTIFWMQWFAILNCSWDSLTYPASIVQEGLELSLASSLSALKSLNILKKLVRTGIQARNHEIWPCVHNLLRINTVNVVTHESMKDKSTECEARKFITQAHRKGNSGVQKVVDYTRQQLGCKLHATSNQKPKIYYSSDPVHFFA